MTGVELTEAEELIIWRAYSDWHDYDRTHGVMHHLPPAVTEIVAARLAPVEAERDEWRAASDDFADKIVSLDKRVATADGTVKTLARRLSDVEHNALEVGGIAHFAEARAAKAEALVEAGLGLADEWDDRGLQLQRFPLKRSYVVDVLRAALGRAES